LKNLGGIGYGKMRPIGLRGNDEEAYRRRVDPGMVAVGLIGACRHFRARHRRRHVRADGQNRYQSAGGNRGQAVGRGLPPCPAFRHCLRHLPPHLGANRTHHWLHDLRLPRLDRDSKKKPGEALDDDSNIAYFKAAYHKLCITCHKEIKVKNQALQRAVKTLDKPLPKSGRLPARSATPNKFLPRREGRQEFIYSHINASGFGADAWVPPMRRCIFGTVPPAAREHGQATVRVEVQEKTGHISSSGAWSACPEEPLPPLMSFCRAWIAGDESFRKPSAVLQSPNE